MNGLVDKVANAPPLVMAEGWPARNGLRSDNHEVAHPPQGVGVKDTGAGSRVSEELPARYNVAHPSSSSLPVHLTASPGHPADPRLTPRLHPVLQHDARGPASDSDDPDQALGSKAASFYIGGDDALSPPITRQKSQTGPGTPWKVPGAGSRVVEFTPPDGGYGWVVALAACFINLWIIGFTKSYGVLYVAIRETFPEASAYHISWVPSLLSTVGLLTAPVTGIMCRRFTSRKVSFFGGSLCFLGLLLGSMASNVNQLIASVGLLTGLGSGITTTSGILIVSLYFERRRTIGSSICLSGNALGGFFMPPLVDHLLKTYGLRGAFLILAALQLHICAASMLFRPISLHALVQAAELRRKDKLLPSVAASSPTRFSSPSHLKTFWSRMRRHYVSVESVQESEVQRQVSFLRSASMLNSVPNLTLYARSWSVSGGPAFPDSRPSFNVGSRSSLSNNSTSKWSLTRLPMFAEHPTVMRLSSEDESIQRSASGLMHHGGSRRSSLPRILGGVDHRSSLTRQTSIRTAHSRIMESLQEQDKEDSEGILQSTSPDCDEKEESEQMIKEEKDNEKSQIKQEEREPEKKENMEEEEKPSCCLECLRGLCDASLFKDGQFWVVAISVFLVACGTPFSLFYLPSYADSISIPSSSTTGMLSVSSIVDLIGRLSTGVISDLHFCQLHYIYFISSLSAGSAVLILPHVTDTAALTGVLCVFGFFVGSWFVTIPAMLADHHGTSKLAASYGIVRLFNGIMNFISPQATGMLYDATQSYKAVYTLMGTSMVTGSVLVLLSPLVRRNKNNNNNNNNNNNDSDGNTPEDKNGTSKKSNPDDNAV
ncbi:hypothetical protein O3P69_000642 [Scylla paramamosain]|uniref:Monocarboxylate transporter n=1 Tax=Scylla paramamosain TaxID=85552 RepID=A0AAW0UR23_SCYPA